MSFLRILEPVAFSLVLWFGLYLIDRDPRNPLTRNAGLGLAAYAAALAASFFAAIAEGPEVASTWTWVLLLLPPYFWSGAVFHLPAREFVEPSRALRIWKNILPAPLLLLAGAATVLSGQMSLLWKIGFLAWATLPLIAGLCVLPALRRQGTPPLGYIILPVAASFYLAGQLLLAFPMASLPTVWVLLGTAFDLGILGAAIAWFDALHLGEKLRTDLTASLTTAAALALLLGGQVVFAMAISTGPTPGMFLLLHWILVGALLSPIIVEAVLHAADRGLYGRRQHEAASPLELRAAARGARRADPDQTPESLDPEVFFRHTRRALSDFGSLPRLTANPLVRLPEVTEELRRRDLPDSPLERARILKSILAAAVMRLKPGSDLLFDDTDEWRYFNALYFPYVLGLRPYSRKMRSDDLSADAREAMRWFRTQVPERTLHNWQNAAARLIAEHLRNQT